MHFTSISTVDKAKSKVVFEDSVFDFIAFTFFVCIVRDRSAIKTSDDETRALAPTGLQAAIDAVVAQRGVAARAFVRPSGTEDIVRTYAECDSRDAVDALERDVADCVHRLAGGV